MYAIDLGHPARAGGGEDFVGSKARTGGQGHELEFCHRGCTERMPEISHKVLAATLRNLEHERRPIPESQVQVWAEVLAHELNHRCRPCLHEQVVCEVFHHAKPTMRVYTLRKRKEAFDWINELTMTLIQVWAVHTQRQAETARRLAVETWLQRNGVITITQNKKVLPVFLEQFAHNWVAPTITGWGKGMFVPTIKLHSSN